MTLLLYPSSPEGPGTLETALKWLSCYNEALEKERTTLAKAREEIRDLNTKLEATVACYSDSLATAISSSVNALVESLR